MRGRSLTGRRCLGATGRGRGGEAFDQVQDYLFQVAAVGQGAHHAVHGGGTFWQAAAAAAHQPGDPAGEFADDPGREPPGGPPGQGHQQPVQRFAQAGAAHLGGGRGQVAQEGVGLVDVGVVQGQVQGGRELLAVQVPAAGAHLVAYLVDVQVVGGDGHEAHGRVAQDVQPVDGVDAGANLLCGLHDLGGQPAVAFFAQVVHDGPGGGDGSPGRVPPIVGEA